MIAVDCPDGSIKEVSGKDLLIFTTGSDREPPLGFMKTARVFFNHDPEAKLATASTCDLHLCLPIRMDYSQFKQMMLDSLLLYNGFGAP